MTDKFANFCQILYEIMWIYTGLWWVSILEDMRLLNTEQTPEQEAKMLCPMKFMSIGNIYIDTNDRHSETNIELECICEKEKCAWWCENGMCAARSMAELLRVMYRLLPIEKEEK